MPFGDATEKHKFSTETHIKPNIMIYFLYLWPISLPKHIKGEIKWTVFFNPTLDDLLVQKWSMFSGGEATKNIKSRSRNESLMIYTLPIDYTKNSNKYCPKNS